MPRPLKKSFLKFSRRHDKIFIIPTRYGIYFLAIIFILFLISLSYGHSLAFTTTFIFVSLVMISAHFTNFNLAGVEVVAVHPPLDLHAKDRGEIRVTLRNNQGKTRFDLLIELGGEFYSRPISLGKGEVETVHLPVEFSTRGELELQRITISSSFPFGLFYAWKYWYLDSHFIIYPEVSSTFPPLPQPESLEKSRGSHKGKEEIGSEEFYGHKSYHEGMPLRSIDWKAYARGKGILLKQFVEESDLQFLLNIESIKGNLEEKISILAAWIEEAEKLGVTYAVDLKEKQTKFGRGRGFKRDCLKALSTYQKEKKVLS